MSEPKSELVKGVMRVVDRMKSFSFVQDKASHELILKWALDIEKVLKAEAE